MQFGTSSSICAAPSGTSAAVNKKLCCFDSEAAVLLQSKGAGISEDESVVALPYSHRSSQYF